jgi:uracil-DNA glycosylase family 4
MPPLTDNRGALPMSPTFDRAAAAVQDLAAALRDRLESDAILGARELPITPRKPVSRKAPAATSRRRDAGAHSAELRGKTCSLPPKAAASPAPPDTPVRRLADISPDELKHRTASLAVIDDGEVKSCTKCGLHVGRTKTVFGVGSPAARVMFVGEAPGFHEDQQGIPFVGDAGNLLTKMIEAGMGLKREDVYICNVIKCRPPNNRTPVPDEIVACKEYLYRQIRIIRPEVIVALGVPATQTLLGTKLGINRLRGQWHELRVPAAPKDAADGSCGGELPPIPLMPTFHPAYLLRSPSEKKKAWEDLQQVMQRLGLPIPR